MTGHDHPWRHAATLVAVAVEGSGEQHHDDELILEVAAVRLANGSPAVGTSYSTLINPQRQIRRGNGIASGLTDQALAMAPPLGQVAPSLLSLLDGAILVGHNVGVDWRLLHRYMPALRVDGLIDTLTLTRRLLLRPEEAELTAALDAFGITGRVNAVVPAAQPHRALWDAAGAALLLEVLVGRSWQREPSLGELLTAAAPAGYELTQRSRSYQHCDPTLALGRASKGAP